MGWPEVKFKKLAVNFIEDTVDWMELKDSNDIIFIAGQVPQEKFLIAVFQSAYLFYYNSYLTFRGDGQKKPGRNF